MILPGQMIRAEYIITPHHPRTKSMGLTYGEGPAGYDVRIDTDMDLPPGEFALASIMEHIAMPANVQGVVHDKSTWARKGLALQNTIIDPGWRGYLTIEMSNHGRDTLMLRRGMPIAQIVFHLLAAPAEAPYCGKYQDQERGPQQAIMEPSQVCCTAGWQSARDRDSRHAAKAPGASRLEICDTADYKSALPGPPKCPG